MSDEKETRIGPVEQKINFVMESAGDEISDLTQKGPDIFVNETVQNIRILNLSRCIICLAKEIDKLAGIYKIANGRISIKNLSGLKSVFNGWLFALSIKS